MREDLATLRGLPGSRPRASSATSPCRAAAARAATRHGPARSGPRKRCPATTTTSTSTAIDALGVKLIAGRPFEAQEIQPPSETFEDAPQAIVTKAFAKELFPKDENFLGKTFYNGLSEPTTIVGIIEHMHGAWVGWDKLDNVVLFPRIKNGPTRGLPRPGRARPARRGDARHRGEARRLEPGPPAALGPAVRLLHPPVLPRTTATWRSSW